MTKKDKLNPGDNSGRKNISRCEASKDQHRNNGIMEDSSTG